MDLTQEQNQVISGLLKFTKPIQTLSGYAGTGKTTVIAALTEHLPDFAVCAFTGKAANVLRKKGIQASTIHSLIYHPLMGENGEIIRDRNGNPQFTIVEDFPHDGIIVDEASMVNQRLYEDLLSFDVPIIFVGDHGQLEPIGNDVNVMANPDFRLEQIHRNAGEIAIFAEWIRKGYNPAAFSRSYSCRKISFIQKWQADKYLLSVDQIICAFNKTRVALNSKVRYGKGFKTGAPEQGDRVMCLKNNRQIGLFNGMQGTIAYRYHNENRMRFQAEDQMFEVLFDPRQFGRERYELEDYNKDDPLPFDWCYAVTCHKSQGDEWDHVMVFEQYCNRWDMRRWNYTAASRAREGLIWVM